MNNYLFTNSLPNKTSLNITCTKLQTISARGSKKDFIDLYFLLEKYSLSDLFRKLEQKYLESSFNKIHILKSLIYFEDAEAQPMPRMIKQVSWEAIKQKIVTIVKTTSII